MRDPQVRSRLFLDGRRHPAISFRSSGIRRSADEWTASGVLTVKGRPAPLDLVVTDVTTERAALVFRASGTVERYPHGLTTMRGMAARHLSIEITARDQGLALTTPRPPSPGRQHECPRTLKNRAAAASGGRSPVLPGGAMPEEVNLLGPEGPSLRLGHHWR